MGSFVSTVLQFLQYSFKIFDTFSQSTRHRSVAKQITDKIANTFICNALAIISAICFAKL